MLRLLEGDLPPAENSPPAPPSSSEEQFRILLDCIEDYAIIFLDTAGNVTSWNSGAQRIKGFTATEIFGQHVSRFYPDPDVISGKTQRGLAVALAEGRFEEEGLRVRKDGSMFWANVILTPIRDASRRHIGYAKITRDVTDRRRTAEQKAVQAAVFDHSPNAILVFGTDGRMIDVNKQTSELFGYPREAMLGQPSEMLMPTWYRDQHVARRDELFAHRKPLAKGCQMLFGRRADGSEFPMDAVVAPIQHEAKTLGVAILRDMTERQMIEKQLRQSQKMEAVGQLTSGLAHDFNNLLAVAIGNLDLLADRLGDDQEARTLGQEALSACLRGAELTRKLLAFSRKQSLEATAVDINDLVRGTTQLIRRSIGEGIRIQMILSKKLWPVDTDPAQLESALINLAVNSRDAMPEGGTLTIETKNRQLDAPYAAINSELAPGDYVMLSVTDTGSGIAQEDIARVIEPFFTTKDVGKGSGLGLSMIYGFAKQSGGHLTIYSETGHGTTVSLYLPRGNAPLAGAAPLATPVAEPAARRELILVVEDSAAIRKMVVAQMVELGYRTLEAADGASALDIIEAAPGIDLLFTDMVMPGGMSGVQLAEAAKQIRSGLRVLYTSGFTEASLSNGTAKAVARDQLISKPYRKYELAQKLHEALS